MEEKDDSSHRRALDDFTSLRIFMAVVETGSFTKAGERLRVVPSTISKHISSLEVRLSAQLIIRSTKGLSITELGLQFYERCQIILQAVIDAENEVGEYQGEVRGALRVSCAPALLGTNFVGMLDRFLVINPKVKLVLDVSSVAQDLISDGFDIAIRMNNVSNPDLIAVKLAEIDRVYCATPAYIDAFGKPDSVSDLTDHNCLVLNNLAHSANWPMRGSEGETQSIRVTGNLVTNSAEAVVQGLLNNMGIGHIARVFVHGHLMSGELLELLPNDRVASSKVYAVYAERKHLPLKTRAFIDHLRSEFSKPPWTEE